MNNIEHLLKRLGVEEDIKSFEEQQILLLEKQEEIKEIEESIKIIYLKLRN